MSLVLEELGFLHFFGQLQREEAVVIAASGLHRFSPSSFSVVLLHCVVSIFFRAISYSFRETSFSGRVRALIDLLGHLRLFGAKRSDPYLKVLECLTGIFRGAAGPGFQTENSYFGFFWAASERKRSTELE